MPFRTTAAARPETPAAEFDLLVYDRLRHSQIQHAHRPRKSAERAAEAAALRAISLS